MTIKSEIRDSVKEKLISKARKQDYGKYLYKATITKLRGFSNETIAFEFPVTALIGPNGSGKSSILGVAGCAYKSIKPGLFFPKSVVGDESMGGWAIEYELVDKGINPKGLVKRSSSFRQAKWVRGDVATRDALFFGIERTVPAGEKSKYKKLTRSTYKHRNTLNALDSAVAEQIKHILGKSVSDFKVTTLNHDDSFFVGSTCGVQYSEFHFGAGESSIIRMVQEIENAPQNSIILIEEIENGLHPVATRRMVEYLIDVADRKSIQAIFTTHSDYALMPLPSEAIWACIDGRITQGKLSIEALRAVSGRIDKKLAIFVEDEFAKQWVESILREHIGVHCDQIEVHAVAGDGNAVTIHKNHQKDPSIEFKSLCIIDGDSKQNDSESDNIIRLPGEQPERTIFEYVYNNKHENIALLTVACQRPIEAQRSVSKALDDISASNRDPHNIFAQFGKEIGFVPELIVIGAFLSLWERGNTDFCKNLAAKVMEILSE